MAIAMPFAARMTERLRRAGHSCGWSACFVKVVI